MKNPSMNDGQQEAEMPPATMPNLAQKNLGQLSGFAAAREARGMSSTQGPHNKGGGGPFTKNTIAPRSG